jgi:hypothetical protein
MPLRTTLPIALALCFAAIPAQAGTPVLFRSGIACDLSIDGESAGSIAANGFRRVVLSTGEHIVECKGSFYVQTPNSGAPFLVSTTIKVEGTDQKVVVLPQAVLHLGDLSKIQGSAGMTAYIAAEGHWRPGATPPAPTWDNDCKFTDIWIPGGAQLDLWPASTRQCPNKYDERNLPVVSISYGGKRLWIWVEDVSIQSAQGFELHVKP